MLEESISFHLNYKHSYFQFCREEQNIVALLYFLLLNDDSNIKILLDEFKIESTSKDILKSEIYIEYSFIRDIWAQFTPNNSSSKINEYNGLKRNYILNFIKRKRIKINDNAVNDSVEKFNRYFGCNSKKHIQSPSNWRVKSLKKNIFDKFKIENDFLELCKFKWSFNIKPDLVLMLGNNKVICIEAKLESGESSYPSDSNEKKIWNNIFGEKKNRVKQTELQKYMFSEILGVSNVDLFVIDKSGSKNNSISWRELFMKLKIDNPFVSKFISTNKYLQ